MHAEFIVFGKLALKSIKQAGEFRSDFNVIFKVLKCLVLWMLVKLNVWLWHNFFSKLNNAVLSKILMTVTGNSNRVIQI